MGRWSTDFVVRFPDGNPHERYGDADYRYVALLGLTRILRNVG